jgi:ornithine--oxo-acid transaminase
MSDDGHRGTRPDLGELIEQRAGEAMELNQRYLNRQLGRVVKTLGFDREWVHGRGAYLIDATGAEYLDLYAGYGVFSLGRNHPYVRDQLMSVMAAEPANLPQIGVTTLAGVLAEELVARAGDPIDAAATGRDRILYCERAFHGLTNGSLSVNGNAEFRDRFGSLLPGCGAVPFGDLDALRRELAAGDVAAFIVEPIQGKGVYPAPEGYLAGAGAACRSAGALLVVDEVQTGLGRTGSFLCLEQFGDVRPDMVTLSKALSGGFVPVGATLCSRAVFERTFDSMENSVVHGSTFGNNDLAAAAGLATLRVLDDEGLVARARSMGDLLMSLTAPLVDRYEIVREVRGRGLMWAIELGPPAGRTARRLWEAIERRQPGMFAQMVTVPLFHEHRILTQVAGHHMNVIKALPPLVIAEDDLRRFASALDDVLADAQDHLLRSYASLGVGLGRRTLTAR